MREKFDKNGAKLFCDQKGYLACYNIQREQCIAELSPLKDECLAKANAKFPAPANEAELDQYAQYFSVCLATRHLVLHANADVSRIGACMKNLKLDVEQRDKSLWQ